MALPRYKETPAPLAPWSHWEPFDDDYWTYTVEDDWPQLPPTSPQFGPLLPTAREKYGKPYQVLPFSSLHYTVEDVPVRRRWTHDDNVRTFDEWRQKELERDTAFLAYIHPDLGAGSLVTVFYRMPGLFKPVRSVDDVTWFLREAVSPGSYLRRLLRTMADDDQTRPPISQYQLVLLVLLTASGRRMTTAQVLASVGSVSSYWARPEQRVEFGDMVEHVRQSRLFEVAGTTDFQVHAGEENSFLTNRYSKGLLLDHSQTPPYCRKRRHLNTLARSNDDAVSNAASSQRSRSDLKLENASSPTGFGSLHDGLLLMVLSDATFDGVLVFKQLPTWTARLFPAARIVTIPHDWDGRKESIEIDHVPKGWFQNILRLRLVSARLSVVVLEAIFRKMVIFQRNVLWCHDAFGSDGHNDFEFFVPKKYANAVEEYDIAILYHIEPSPGTSSGAVGSYYQRLDCRRDVLDVKAGEFDRNDLASYRDDSEALNGNWFVRSSDTRGLQVRGYLFSVSFPNVSFMGVGWEQSLHIFLWKLMTKPEELAKVGSSTYVLCLGELDSEEY